MMIYNRDMSIWIGTSGFSYKHWRGKFYPEEVKPGDYLQYYSSLFSTVEINSSFYHFPRDTTISKWKNITPDHFLFAMKASRFITHMRKLNDSKDLLARFLELIEPLGPKLGPILFQLPPQMKVDQKILGEFLFLLPKNFRCSFEFRHESWYTDSIFDLLKEHNCALCIHDHKDAPAPAVLTADFSYLRFHGPDGGYLLKYSESELKHSADFILANQSLDAIYCYFNNDTNAYAVENAFTLKSYLSKESEEGRIIS